MQIGNETIDALSTYTKTDSKLFTAFHLHVHVVFVTNLLRRNVTDERKITQNKTPNYYVTAQMRQLKRQPNPHVDELQHAK